MSESETESVTAFEAFKKLLGSLGLQEFPCGFGTWRETPQIQKKAGTIFCQEEISAMAFKDSDAKYENAATLLEYATSPLSPWCTDCDWSNEAAKLRQIAITASRKFTDKFICNYFTTLRIRDKNVVEIDADMLKLKNLKELTLSANRIVDAVSKNLPPSLKTLELSGNNITDLEPLCVQPPPLVHLGLSYNRVDSISEHLTAQHWPQLLCLDLFHNNLCDLLEVGHTLMTLPKLQSLVLVGNPLSLVPGYRGFLIDCLPTLNILDDFTITADEKLNYKSLHLHTDCIHNVAFIKLSISHVKGLPQPQEEPDTDDIIRKSYFIKVLFIHEEENDAKQSDVDEVLSVDKTIPSVSSLQMETVVEENTSIDGYSIGSYPNSVMTEKNAMSQSSHNRSFLPYTNYPPQATKFIHSQDLPWMEGQIDFNWEIVISHHNLQPLRDYLYQDIEFQIIEKKLVGRLPEEEEEEDDKSKGKGKDDKKAKKKKEEKEKGKKDAKSTKSDPKTKAGKGKDKKGKISDENIIWASPKFKSMATFYLNLEAFLHGEHTVEETFIKEMNNNIEVDVLKITKRASIQKKKNGSSSRVESRAKGGKSAEPKKGKPSLRSRGSTLLSTDEDCCQLPPLEMGVVMELKHWTSTDQALQAATTE